MAFNDDDQRLAPEIILGARQLANPEGIAPRLDTEGPPVDRISGGAKMSYIPPYSDQGDVSNPPAADVSPGMMREASAQAPAGAAPPSAMQPSEQQAPKLFPEHQNTPEQRMNEIPRPISGAEGQTAHAAKLRLFGDAEEKLDSALLRSPDEFADPLEYTKHLEALRAGRGALRQAKAEYELQHPWGSMESAHPGFFGKLGHAFGEIGSVAAPRIAAEVPGSRPYLEQQRALGGQEIKEAAGGEAQAIGGELKQAQGELAQAKVPTEEAKQSEIGAKQAKEEAQTQAIELSGGKKVEKLSDNSLIEVTPNPDGSSSAKMIYKGDPKRQTAIKEVMVGGKPHQALFDKNTGEQIADLGEAPPSGGASADKGTTMVTPEGKVIRATPGMTVTPGTQTPSGYAEMGRPTVQQRNVAGQAQVASESIPGVIKEIDRLRDQLGPVSGRWNEFMQGKVGMDNPDMAGLRADLMMVGTAVALAHARGRLPENLREEFDRAINAPKQSPENLKATLNHIMPYMQRMVEKGEGPGKVPETAAPTGGFAAWKAQQGAK